VRGFWLSALLLSIGALPVAAEDVEALKGLRPENRRIMGEWRLPAYYPGGFDGVGTIDRIGEGEIVIDDRRYSLAPGLQGGTLRRKGAKLRDFRPGQTVGFMLSAQRVIDSLWVLELSPDGELMYPDAADRSQADPGPEGTPSDQPRPRPRARP